MEPYLEFPTRRIVKVLTSNLDDQKTMCTYTCTISTDESDIIQLCSLSFTGDKRDKVLGSVIESIDFSSPEFETLTGNTLTVRNALLGVRSTYDMAHNRTHVILAQNHLAQDKSLTVTIKVKQLSEQELKDMFSAKCNADLFHNPELFFATIRLNSIRPSRLTDQILCQSHITPICKVHITVPYLDMNQFTKFQIKLGDYLSKLPNLKPTDEILQIWFSYEVLNIQTTSSMFQKLELKQTLTGEIAHQYSSPVQLQVLDKFIWNLFSSNQNARAFQEKYMTITTSNVSVEELSQYELEFTMHSQFHKDYATWITQNRNQLDKDAVMLVHFGFLFC